MGFFSRLFNVIKGFFSNFIGKVEEKNPELVYEAAIQERLKKQKELKVAVSRIIHLRNKTEAELKEKQEKLADVEEQLEIAAEEEDDEAGEHLWNLKMELESEVTRLTNELEDVKGQSDKAMASLNQFREAIKDLKREKERMLAKAKTAEAKRKIEESLSGFSVDADSQALENVRESIERQVAETQVTEELNENSIDGNLKRLEQKAKSRKSKSGFAAYKRKKKQGAAGGGGDGGKPNFNKNI